LDSRHLHGSTYLNKTNTIMNISFYTWH
jgi:hypothetical protein